MARIIAIGYYSRANLGDQQYLDTLPYLVGRDRELICIDSSALHQFPLRESDVVLIASGDLLVEFFLDHLYNAFHDRKNTILAVCVGVPYTRTLLQHRKLGIIDHVFVRTRQDVVLLSQFFPKHKVHYIPDISYYLYETARPVTENTTPEVCSLYDQVARGAQLFGVSLNRHIYCQNKEDNYNKVVRSIARLLTNVIETHRMHVVFAPFNTNWNKSGENDILIHRDVARIMTNEYNVRPCYYTLVERDILPRDMLCLFSLFSAALPMRFHACLFALYNNVPMMPVYTTRKVKNLILDTNYPYSVHLPCDDQDVPTRLPFSQALECLSTMLRKPPCMLGVITKFGSDLATAREQLLPLLTDQCNKVSCRQPDRIIKAHEASALVDDVSDKVKIISYYLTGTTQSVYNYGLHEKIHSKSYVSEWKWVIEDHLSHVQPAPSDSTNGLFNLSYVDQRDYASVHRSGWRYVHDALARYNDCNSKLLLDLYVDRTFHWDANVLKVLGVIPYTQPWVGFVHHTFNTTFSEHNCSALIQNDLFKQSLLHCKCLIVLSERMRMEWRRALISIGFGYVPVRALVHPTETNVPKFSMIKYRGNMNKYLLHIGGWLRDVYSFYRIELGSLPIAKAALKGSHMSNYFPPDTMMQDLDGMIHRQRHNQEMLSAPQPILNVSTNPGEYGNNWVSAFRDATMTDIKSVKIIDRLSNSDYDNMLTRNIVFLNLVDASAVNTVIECVVRHTPLLVNRLPALEELLGKEYPFFYDGKHSSFETSKTVQEMLTPTNIQRCHTYLTRLSMSRYSIDGFVKRVAELVKELA